MSHPLLAPAIQSFIRDHTFADVAALALKKSPDPAWPYADILAQIKARQKTAKKLPTWLDVQGVLFPPPDVMEQASSIATARYKASLLEIKMFIDLTGGSGADSFALSGLGTVIEKDPINAEILAHNAPFLALGQIQVIQGAAEDILPTLPPADLILLDPQRRNTAKRGIFRLEDGSPNILELLPILREKTRYVLLKTSPLLDIRKTLEDLPHVASVHIVEWEGECKEVLYLLDFVTPSPPPTAAKASCEAKPHYPPPIGGRAGWGGMTAVSVNHKGMVLKTLSFQLIEEENCPENFSPPQAYLFEPGPAFLKAGAFKLMAERYGLSKLARHTHLYTGPAPCPDFPGRSFKIVQTLPAQKSAVKEAIPTGKANLSIRNFPMSVDDLKKKLSVKDGGEETLFACTLENDEKVLIHARKF